ncbi:MAG TPA: serine hydrolase domain-containing protein [Pyrinomonadaceae bacterium]|jgi:CubicO group peptidase (beta-lactamase class C family)
MIRRFLLIILGCGLFAGGAVRGQEIKATVRGETGKRIDDYLTSLVDKGFSGAVLAAKKDRIFLAKGYGFVDREKRVPVTPATVFPVGSVTKQFTAAAVVKLEMQGKLKFSDSIAKYLNDVPADKAKITIHQLLTHSSGIPGSVGRCTQEMKRNEFVKMALNSTLDFEPGTRYNYSNAGYNLLAVIVETASGEEFEEYAGKNLFAPAGLKQTGIFVPKYALDNIAVGYRDGKKWGNVYEKLFDYDYPDRKFYGYEFCGRGSGGMLSTIGDLYRWHKSFAGEKVFSKASKEKIFASYVREGEGATSFYGYGWAIFTTPRKTKLIAHNGNVNDVFEADFRRYTEEDVVLIIITNSLYLEQGAIKISPQIAKIIFDNPGK